ncbi:MAG TPA: DUF2189 domain-containing protein [Sphingomonadaceae bacterium]|nr:DUF2189 domain-containing protein [Sphingomonadaceae bacterium]
MTQIPPVVPPLPRTRSHDRQLPVGSGFAWLRAGWADLWHTPGPSLAYGVGIFLLSTVLITAMVLLRWDYILFPALAGFMVVGPFLALGLYDKSRRLARGESVSLARMIVPEIASRGQVLFTGALLCLLMLVWMRAAVIVYALFFGVGTFPGLDHIAPMLFTTPTGWAMLIVGSVVGGLFAACAFAISAFSIPMMLDRRLDALTAMGTSWALVIHNLPALLVWAAIVLVLSVFSLVTGMLGLILVFPLLGHATWHAYEAVR